MAKAKISSAVKKIENKYIKAREQYEKITKEIENLERGFEALDKSLYSSVGMQAEKEKYQKQRKELEAEFSKIRKEFRQEAEIIKKDSDKIFDRKYCYTPQDIDANGLAILDKGNLTASEIMRLGENYKAQGNNTMYFMCADKLKDNDDATVRAWRINAKALRDSREDHAILDEFTGVCLKGLRDEINLSNSVHKHLHDDSFRYHVNQGDGITVEVENPWE